MTLKEYHSIIEHIKTLVDGTEWEGHVYAVGGCCRDELLNRDINDIDIAVDLPDGGVKFAHWLEHKRLLVGHPVVFARFGTAKLRLRRFPDHEIELVQTRAEKYTDRNSRNPSTAFGSLEDDCLRRDLTINSLYYDISRERLLDITGKGVDDIRNHIIRTPSEPDSVFDDDPVRILRCIRFAAKYGWEVQEPTWEGLKNNVKRLSVVTPERLFAELDKMLTGPHPAIALEMLKESGALKELMPEMEKSVGLKQNKYHFGTVWEHTLKVVEHTPARSLLRWAALLHDVGKINSRSVDEKGVVHFYGHERCGNIIRRVLSRFKSRPEFIKKVVAIAENHMRTKGWGNLPDPRSLPGIRRMQLRLGSRQNFENALALIDADNRAHAPEYCMPDQVACILELAAEDASRGVNMYDYKLPVPLRRIMKIVGVKHPDHPEVRDYVKRLLDKACDNPKLTRGDCERMVQRWHDSSK